MAKSQSKKMKMTPSSSKQSDPGFLKYLFNPDLDHDCYVVVGNPSLAPVERIGVVKQMLFAHSSVMRTDLQVLNIKEKKPIEIKDIFPDTFRDLLRFVYGHDTTASLSFDEADNLLYAAEKYDILPLKNQVAIRLQALLSHSNICSLMNNKVCYETLGLSSQINKILQFETAKVFASPHFLELTSDAFVKLLEQQMLNVREIEVWRNAIKWAKHKAKRGDGKSLRKELEKPLKHIRVCSLQMEDFCREVVPTKVLLDHEVTEVCVAMGNKKKQTNLTKICNRVDVRPQPFVKSETKLKVLSYSVSYNNLRDGNLTIHTTDLGIEVSSITMGMESNSGIAGGLFKLSLIVERVGETQENVRSASSSSTDRSNSVTRGNFETKVTVTRICAFNHGEITIPISKDGEEVHLQSQSVYRFNIRCDRYFSGYSNQNQNTYGWSGGSYHGSSGHNSLPEDIKVTPGSNSGGISALPIKKIEYKTLTIQV